MTNTSDTILEDSIFRVGRVVSVKGRTVEVKVDKSKNSSHLMYKGELLRNVSVGGYIKIVKGFTSIIGKVEGEIVTEDRSYSKGHRYGADREKIDRVLTVSLLGFFKGRHFERGIKEMPLIDNECFLLHRAEFEDIHDFVRAGDTAITLGSLSFEKGQEIRIGVNGLFASHIGIFGNTGSGKSYTLAKIYRELFLQFKDKLKFKRDARFFIIDFNGEYADGSATDAIIVDKKYKSTYCLSTRTAGGDRFPISVDTLTDPDFWVVFLEATEKTQTPFLRRAVTSTFLAAKVQDPAELKWLLERMIHQATTDGDRNMEKAVVTNFLTEVNDALGGNASLGALLADYKAHLQYHSGQKKFYYQPDNGAAIYSEAPAFKADCIDAKVGALDIDLSTLSQIDQIRLQIILQYYDDIIRGFANKEHADDAAEEEPPQAGARETVADGVGEKPENEQRDHQPSEVRPQRAERPHAVCGAGGVEGEEKGGEERGEHQERP